MAKLTKAQQADKAEAIERLREYFPVGSTVFTVLRNVSRSGMMRHIDVYAFEGEAKNYMTGLVAKALGYTRTKSGELKVSGCGMDMGFAVAYELSYTLYPQGFECIGEKCRSSDHSNGDRDRTPHHHESGGYALKHTWI